MKQGLDDTEQRPNIRRWRVRGRVQGVGFRWWLAGHAREIGVHGWVRNLPDGDVEIAAGGDPGALDELRRLAAKGPPGARVDELVELDASPDELPSPFRIMR